MVVVVLPTLYLVYFYVGASAMLLLLLSSSLSWFFFFSLSVIRMRLHVPLVSSRWPQRCFFDQALPPELLHVLIVAVFCVSLKPSIHADVTSTLSLAQTQPGTVE